MTKNCRKCGHTWESIKPQPLKCPRCNQPRYWEEKVRNVGTDGQRVSTVGGGLDIPGVGERMSATQPAGDRGESGRGGNEVHVSAAQEVPRNAYARTPEVTGHAACDPEYEPPVCGFKAYNEEQGETMACGLPKHGAGTKHGNWQEVQ